MAPPCLPRLLAALICTLAATCALPAAAIAGDSVTVGDTSPDWAVPANEVGDEASSERLVFSLWLGWRNAPALAQLLADQQDPGSPGYRAWVTPGEFRARFAPAESGVQSVSRWLRQEGFEIVSVPRNRLFVTAAGSVAKVEAAFDVNQSLYRLDGHLMHAPDGDPRIPVEVGRHVRAITGLDSSMALAEPRSHQAAPPPPVGRSVGPCSRWWADKRSYAFPNPLDPGRPLPWLICGYTPDQIASAYGIDRLHRAGIDGRGQTIAITGAFFSPTIRTDINTFSQRHGLPKLNGLRYREIVAPGTRRYPRDPTVMQSWYIEQSLDVEWAHAIAPQARIVYVGAANDARGLDLALNHAVDNRVADVISNSWGMPESYASKGEVKALNAVFQQAAATGIGIYFASGDDGDNLAAYGKISAGFPDSSPLVTSVGGTSLAIARDGRRLFETGWGTGGFVWDAAATRWAGQRPFGHFLYGGGGGVSKLHAQPFYQRGVVPSALASWKGRIMRAEPDVALVADPQTGAVFTQSWSTPSGGVVVKDSWIGGTSLGTPIMAAVASLADQLAGRSLGFLNPTLYGGAGSGAFHDITPSSGTLGVLRNGLDARGRTITHLRSLDHDSSLATRPGWDNVTGLGSPSALELLRALS